MRTSLLCFASMFVCSTFAFAANAGSPCETLSTAAAKGENGQVLALINSGVSVNCSYTGSYVKKSTGKTVTYSSTPLNEAAYWGGIKTVRLLLSYGANVNLTDGRGHTPLYNADMGLEDLYWGDGSDQEIRDADEAYETLKKAGGVFK